MNELIYDACGIQNLIVSITEPSIEAAQEMMEHPDVPLLAITGGPGVVRQALRSGKKLLQQAKEIHHRWLMKQRISRKPQKTLLLAHRLITTFCVQLRKA